MSPFEYNGGKIEVSDLIRKKAMDNWFGGGIFSVSYKADRLQDVYKRQATIVTNSNACVTFNRADLLLPLDNWIEATTEHPAPTISPIPVKSISKGTQIFTAAIPSLPTPCPTNIPSIAVTADILSIPCLLYTS